MKRIKHGEHGEHGENIGELSKYSVQLPSRKADESSWSCAVFAVIAVVKDFFLHAIALAYAQKIWVRIPGLAGMTPLGFFFIALHSRLRYATLIRRD